MKKSKLDQTVRRRHDDHSETSDSSGRHIRIQSHDLKNTRDLRTLLVDAAFQILGQPDLVDVHIYLYNCTLARKRVKMEVEQFRCITRPQIAQRVHLDDIRASTQQSEKPASDVAFPALTRSYSARKPATASQEAVLAYLLQRHLQSLPGVSIGDIAAQTGASLPTIYKSIKAHEHCIEKDPEEKTLRLRYFAQGDWFYWIQRANKLSSVYFIDRSGTPRSSARLAKALARLQRDDLAVGGLSGALHHLPALDASSSPQLDILVHGTRRADLSFITEIDPGLQQYKGRKEKADVVVHFLDRPNSLFVREDCQTWGALPDCIANLQKAGLTYQVNDALRLINQVHK
jgi:hypothetical protein